MTSRQTLANRSGGIPATCSTISGRVPREVPLQHLEYAARVLQRLVGVGAGWAAAPPEPCASPRPACAQAPADGPALRAAILAQGVGILVRAAGRLDLPALVPPGLEVVVALLGVQAGEHAVEVLGVGEVLGQDRGRVGVGHHVLPEVLLAAAARS